MLGRKIRLAESGRLAAPKDAAPAKRGDQDRPIDVSAGFRTSFSGLTFLCLCVLPTLATLLYLTFVATPEYVSEARFTIRTASSYNSTDIGAAAGISAMMGLSGASRASTQDIFIVTDYIRSRSIIEDAGGKDMLYQIYSVPDIDWLSRLSASSSFEKVWKYWNRKVSAIIDTPSGVVTLEVRAFSASDAKSLAELVLKKGESLVNDISEHSRRDALARAAEEIRLAEVRLQKARAELLDFRNKTKMIDPALSAQSINDSISKLMQDRFQLENNRATSGNAMSPDSPTQRILTGQIDAIDRQIDNLKDQLTSQSKSNVISAQISDYQNLQIEVQFVEKLYSIAQASYEKARIEQERQQLYLVTTDRPNTPETALYPRIFRDTATIFIASFILWSMLSLAIASIRDHMGG